MKICVAQTKPIKGDIQYNIEDHKKTIELAVSNKVDVIIFPELSITGYEPELAKELAVTQEDSRFDDFQEISDAKQITIGVGAPVKSNVGICIGMIIFQPKKARRTYLKKYLHTGEEEFFVSGENFTGLLGDETKVAVAICYELSVHEHSENAFKKGAEVYIASVVESVGEGVEQSLKKLSNIAKKYSMIVLMSNCIGQSGNYNCAGKTSIWNNKGVLLGQLNDTNEGIIIIDTTTQEIIKKMI